MSADAGRCDEPTDGAEPGVNSNGRPGAATAFESFLGSIVSDALRKVALQWRSACGRKRMPAWRGIDPAAMPAQLSVIWSWKYDRDTDSFTGRLSGEDINALLGRSLRRAAMKDVFACGTYDLVFARYKRIVSEPSFMRGHGKIFAGVGRIGCGERIGLPLSEDGCRSDGIIGATAYQIIPMTELCRCSAEGFCGPFVEFSPLD